MEKTVSKESRLGKEDLASYPTATKCFVHNHPNPFDQTTVISIHLPQTQHVVLKVFDVMGRLIMPLVDDLLPAGTHEVEFDGSHLPSGVYFCRLQAGEHVHVSKMLLAK